MSKNNYDQFNLPPTGPNLCDFYGQYIGFGGGGPTGVQLTSIAKSALFDSANSEYLSRTPDSAGNLRKWTLSLWAYRSDFGTGEFKLWSAISSSNFDMVAFSGNELGIEINTASSNTNSLRSNALFRDQGWYHIVVVWDSDNSTATNRIRAWVNGKRITSWRVSAFPGSAGVDSLTNSTVLHTLGAKANVSQYFDGYLAESVLINGSALEPTSFAEYDPTGTFWVPKSPAVIKALTFGSTGFYLDNATNAQTDAGSEGNNFTNNNTVLTSSHTCTKIYGLWNSLIGVRATAITTTNGNQTAAQASASDGIRSITSTLPFPSEDSKGFYAEITCTNLTDLNTLGIHSATSDLLDEFNFGTADYFLYDVGGGKRSSGNTQASYGNSYADGDVIGIFVKNGKVYFSKNGTFQNSGDPSDGAESGFAFENITGPVVIIYSGGGNGTPYTISLNSGQNSYAATAPAGAREISTTAIAAATALTRTKSDLSEYFESIVYEGNGFGQTVGRHLPFTNSYTVAKSGLFQFVSTGQNAGNDSLQSTSALANGTSNQKFTFSFWFKVSHGHADMSSTSTIFNHSTDDSGLYTYIFLHDDNKLKFSTFAGSNTQRTVAIDTPIFDQSKWYHAVCAVDTTQSTALDRIIWYLDGVRQAVTVTNQIAQNNTGIGLVQDVTHSWGSFIASSPPRLPFDGYLAEIVYNNNIQDVPGSFGETDAATGAWVPKSLSGMSFEATGYYLNFATLGADVSGNSNTFTSSGVTQVNDSPTTNFGTLLNNKNSAEVLTNGNRSAKGVSGQSYWILPSGLRMTTEKIFVACRMDDGADGSSQVNVTFGCQPPNANIDGANVGVVTDSYAAIDRQGGDFRVFNNYYDDAPGSAFSESHTISAADTDVITMAVDPSDPHNGKVWFGVYDTSEDSHQYIPNVVGGTAGDPALGTLPTVDGINFKGSTNPLGEWRIFTGGYRHTAATTVLLDSADIPITIPSGFLEYKQSNIKKGRTIAAGSSADEITPSYTTAWNWLKNRDAADSHMIFDRVRGATKDIHADANSAQVTDANTMYQFLRGGVRVMNDVQVNTEKESYVSWQWYMEATGTGSSNTDGSINTTSTLVDTNLGMSISEYVGTGSAATVGHGLGVAPEFIMIKNLDQDDHWLCYHSAVGNTKAFFLSLNNAVDDNSVYFNDTSPTSTVFSLGSTEQGNSSSESHIAYSFAPSQFNAIGSYNGNGNANGVFVPTVNSLGIPITPSWIMLKRTDAANAWAITDTGRTPTNPTSLILQGDLPNAELDNSDIDVLHGGFKIRSTDNLHNNASGDYIYLAFGTPIIDTSGRIITAR